MKKILAMLLAALMLLAMVPAMAEGEAPTEITIFYTGTCDVDRNESALLKVFEEKTNTKLTVIETADDADQKLATLLATGDDIDVFRHKEFIVGNKMVNEGFVRPVDDLLEYMPNFMSRWDKETLDLFRASDGKLYMLPNMRDVGLMAPSSSATTGWRTWASSIPRRWTTTTTCYTLSAIMIRTATARTISGAALTEGAGSFQLFSAPFGLPLNCWLVEDGELYWSDAHPRMKEALEFGAKIFADGIAPVEYLTMTSTEAEQLVCNGLAGAWQTVSSANARRMIALREVDTDATSAVLEVPTAEGVEKGYVSMSNIVEVTDLGAKRPLLPPPTSPAPYPMRRPSRSLSSSTGSTPTRARPR